MSARTIFRNATILPMNGESPLSGDVVVDDGTITHVGSSSETRPGDNTINFNGDYLLPGFVHTHIHLCQTLFRHDAEGRTLVDWLQQRILPMEAAHNTDSIQASAQLGIAELMLSGATTLLDMGTVNHTDVIAQTIDELGVRATFGKAMMDQGEDRPERMQESTKASLEQSLTLARKWHGADGGRIRYAFAPRWVLSCTRELQEDIARYAESEGYHIHTHAAEQRDECALVEERYGQRNIHALHTLGLTGRQSVFAHCVHVDEEERQILASTGTSVAHCPSANHQLGSGVCNVPELLADGINVGLGADGAACNNSLDSFHEMLLAHHLQSLNRGPGSLSPKNILEMMTIGGARALGIENDVGTIEVGKQADIIRLGRGDFRLGLGSDPYTEIVLCGARDLLIGSWIRGKNISENGEINGLDQNELLHRSRTERRLILERAFGS